MELLETFIEFSKDYAIETKMCHDENDFYKQHDTEKRREIEYNDIQKILTSQISLYVLRRTRGVDGSHIDIISEITSDLIKEYEKKYKKKFINVNEFADY
jgi:hypothetical protein